MVYFSNGTEGMILDDQCSECPVGEGSCPIYAVQMLYNYDQLKEHNKDLKDAMTLLIDNKGKCEMFKALQAAGKAKQESDPTPIDPKSLPSFLKLDAV